MLPRCAFVACVLSAVSIALPQALAAASAWKPQISVVVMSPQRGDVVGVTGASWLIDINSDVLLPVNNGIISAAQGYSNNYNNITSTSPSPGLVILLSTTGTSNTNSGPWVSQQPQLQPDILLAMMMMMICRCCYETLTKSISCCCCCC